MSDKITVTAEERTVVGKKVKQLRKQGLVPAVMYGFNLEPTSLMLPYPAVEKTWHHAGKHHPVELTVGTVKRLAMIKSVDRDPSKHLLRHISFQVVDKNETVTTDVPVKILGEGETPAEKAGLVLLSTIESVEIEALPNSLPDALEISGDKLAQAGDHVTVADIMPVKGVKILTEPDVIVATVYEPAALAAQNDAAAGDATEDTEVEAEHGSAAPAEAATDAKKDK